MAVGTGHAGPCLVRRRTVRFSRLRGELAEAAAWAREGLRGTPDDPECRVELALAAARSGDVTAAHGAGGAPAMIEVLRGPQPGAPLTADDMGRFAAGTPPAGPFALRLRADGETVVTQWLRA